MTDADFFEHLSQQVLRACAQIACYTDVPGEINRPYLCPCTAEVHHLLMDWGNQLGMRSHVDAVGNLRSRWEGRPGAPTLYIGSHLDTVPNAGAFDGVLGVVMGYALVQAISAQALAPALPFTIEVLGFSEEEGVRYGVPFIGSRALVGSSEALLNLLDNGGRSVTQAITAYGLSLDDLPAAKVQGPLLGYLEIHTEQGPVLQDLGASVGVVEGIAGQNRLLLHFVGRASHAGTTPMYLRRDALAAAARFAVAAEDLARATPGLVATVGVMQAFPGAINVIAGEVSCTLDIRHAHDEVRRSALATLLHQAHAEAAERQVTLSVTPKMEEVATPMSPAFKALLHQAAAQLHLDHPELVSGAGHDAQVMAQQMPAAMLFVRSPNALSHHPDEMVDPVDVQRALRVGVRFLELLAAEVSRATPEGQS